MNCPSFSQSPSALAPAAVPGVESPSGVPPQELMRWLERDNQLLQVRLGIASSLFLALRCKSSHTASHSLRVTMLTGAWAAALGLPEEQRDRLEVASLLHDIGKIGVPDHILLKPGPLSPDEAQVMEQYRLLGTEILRPSCKVPEVLDIVHHCAAWYDGSRTGWELRGDAIPLGARMLAIADAYDAMTTEQVYRPAMSPEMALAELYRCSGRQFDPSLVREFAHFQAKNPQQYHRQVLRRWVAELAEHQAAMWGPAECSPVPKADRPWAAFCKRHLETTRTGVIFVDRFLKIFYWNPGAERLTGISADSAEDRLFVPELLHLRDEDGTAIREADFPVQQAIARAEQRYRRVILRTRCGRDLVVDMHAAPVLDSQGVLQGVVVSLSDVSPELSLVARCQSLYEMATRDPLTQVANRAEFDRVHALFVKAHLERRLPCSLILADLDHFKQINDTYGHQAGDEVLKSFAKLLKSSCRAGDVVARYGGEEFVILCPDCDQAAAARRAEHIRRTLAQMPQASLGGKACTASFGVTELQPGDSPQSMLARADRALYKAKEAGRNVVVQLGSGLGACQDVPSQTHDHHPQQGLLVQQWLATPVPPAVAVQKLRGFVADHRVKVLGVHENRAELLVDSSGGFLRRWSDRRNSLVVELSFFQCPQDHGTASSTQVKVQILQRRLRNRRRQELQERARQVLAALKAYLMAGQAGQEAPGPQDPHTSQLQPVAIDRLWETSTKEN